MPPARLLALEPQIEAAVQKAISVGARLEDSIATHKWRRFALMADPFGNGFPKNGTMAVPPGPGLDLEPDADVIRKFRLG
jgi:hypothetical protein